MTENLCNISSYDTVTIRAVVPDPTLRFEILNTIFSHCNYNLEAPPHTTYRFYVGDFTDGTYDEDDFSDEAKKVVYAIKGNYRYHDEADYIEMVG